MKKILIATIAAIAMSGAASAADMAVKARPAPAPVYNWTGCYLGAGAGYGMYNMEGTQLTAAGAFVATEGTTGGRGWLGQVQAGCDYQFTLGTLGQWVIGAFGDYDFDNIKGNHSSLAGGVAQVGSLTEKSAWAAGGRIGALISPTFLVYESAGWTASRFGQSNYLFAAGGGPSGVALNAQRYNGWFWGSGFEYAFTWLPVQGLFLKTEYRFSQFQSRNVNDIFGGGVLAIEQLKPYTQTVTTELVYRFNWH